VGLLRQVEHALWQLGVSFSLFVSCCGSDVVTLSLPAPRHYCTSLKCYSGVSGGMDSFFEYLLKAGIALGNPDYIKMFSTGYAAIMKHVKKDVW
jgi:hypothetical protein